MKFFSDCSGECCVCVGAGGCLAGHGDDDFVLARKDEIIKRLDENRYPSERGYMIAVLANRYNYKYEGVK